MPSLYTHEAGNMRKTWFLMSIFFIVVIVLGFIFARAFGNPIIVYVAVAIALLMNVTAYWHSDKIVVRMTGAKPVVFEDNKELYRIVENLAITAGLPMPKLYMVDDPVPNAFATGRDKDHAVVAVTSGLLQVLDKTELEGVIAHELSHIGNRDMLIATVAVVLVGFVAILSDIFLRATLWGGKSSDNDSRAGAVMLVVGIVAAILAPIAASLIQLAISRKRELVADASGALLTRYPEGLASALEKIASYTTKNGGKMKKASNATAHLFLANPFGAKAKKGLSNLFSTHPSVEVRVRALRGSEQGV